MKDQNLEIFSKYSSWEEFEGYIHEYGCEGSIPHVFEKIRDNDLLTPSDISYITGYSEETVRRWCRSWKLKTTTGRAPYHVVGSDLKNFLYYWTRKELIQNYK